MAGEEQLNALQDNIKRKGQNAYYYAHSKSGETVKNYGGEPQKVATADPSDLPTAQRKTRISKYSWADGKKTVKVYVPTDFVNGEEIPDDAIGIEWAEKSLTFSLNNIGGKDYELAFRKLNDEIRDVKHKKKEDSIVLTMYKVTEFSWHQLEDK